MIASVLRSLLNTDPPTNKVIETRSDAYTLRNVYSREDGLILYLPSSCNKTRYEKTYFEIVLHRPYTETLHQTYSLFRSSDLSEAEVFFATLRDKLPIFITIARELYNVQGLQKLCDILTEHPTWNLAHIAAYFGSYEAFKNPLVGTFLNSTDQETGMSPLQVAITTKNLKTIHILISSGASLEHLDFNSDSVFHFAAMTSKDIISVLIQNTIPKSLNYRNKNGYTPLHVACQADKPDCVRALLLAGADVNKTSLNIEMDMKPGYVGEFLQKNPNSLYKEDMKMGGTPLHWASSRSVIEALIDMNCHIDALNFEHKTALHIMVKRNRIECVVALLSHHANINIIDADGNCPLHIAVKEGNSTIIQCLIVFGADLNLYNNKGESPRHIVSLEHPSMLYYLHAVGAKRCPINMENCNNGCKNDGTFNGVLPPKILTSTNRDILNQMLDVAAMDVASTKKHDLKKKKGRLLCLDGGGIRGLILVVMLLDIEKALGQPVKNFFEWIAGTSTGGILALGIASGKTLKECLCLYFRIKELTFVGMRPYPSEPLENVLKENFGAETVMSDISEPKVMITGVLADRKPVELHLFRNYESANDILNIEYDSPYELPLPPKEQYVWQVGRATGAAPTYFRAFGRFLDGGLIANNPTLDALSEIQEYNLALKAVGRINEAIPVSTVVSLGTGVIPVTSVKEIDVFLPGNIFDGIKLYSVISSLGTLLVDQATASDGRVVDRARAWCSSIGVPYFRFSPQMSEDIAMNESSDEKLCKMLWETKAYMYENKKVINELVAVLTKD